MSKDSLQTVRGLAFRFIREAAMLSFLGVFALTGCLGGDDGNPHCDPVPYTKTILPIKVQGHDIYFNVNDFDFLLASNIVVSDIQFQGVAAGKHGNQNKDDDFVFDVNGTKCSRNDGDRNVHWNCGAGKGDSSHTPFCSPMQKFSLNGGLAILDFMLKVKFQFGNLRLSAHGKGNPDISNVSIVVTGTEHPKTCNQPPPPPPPPPPVAPTTSITAYAPTESPTNSTTMSITFSADQTGVSYACSLDGAVASACSSPKLYSGLVSGTHTFTVSATNSAGLSDAVPPTLSWVVDTQPPTVTITNASQLPALTNQTAITLQFTSSEASTFTCQLDGGSAAECSSPYSASGLSEGSHKVTITALDSVGNASAFPASFQWAVDVTPPTTTINQVTPAQAINNSSTMSFLFSANETATFDCSVDQGAYSVCTSPMVLDNLAEGSHWFNVRATDVAGNQGQVVSYSWKNDVTPPVVTIVASTPAEGPSNSHSVAVDFASSEPATVTCSLDGAVPAACTTPFTAAIADAGAHSLVITPTDIAGNVGTGTTLNWEMDFTKPILSLGTILPSPAANKNSSTVSLEILANKSVTMSATLNGTDLGVIASPLVLSNLSEGSYTVIISAFDSVGNPADNLTYSFNVDLTAPTISLSSEITGLTNLDRNALTFSADEAATFACNIDEAGFGTCLSPMSLSGLADGVHTVIVRATDSAGNVSAEQTATWTVDTTAPLTTLATTQNGANSYSFALSANETGSTFQCSLDGAPAQACTSPVTVSGLTAGTHTFLAQAIDVAGNVDLVGASSSWTVQLPSTTLQAQQTANDAITFTFSSDVADATFICSLDGAVAQGCTSPLSMSGVGVGSHTFLVKAKDSGNNLDPNGASFTFDVLPPVTTTLNSATPSSAFTNSSTITFVFSANHSNATFICSLNGAPGTACTSPMTYSGLGDGAKTFKVQAVDAWGTVDATGAVYSWTIDTTGPGLVSITTSSTSTSITINWMTNEPATTKLFWGVSPSTANVVPEDSVYQTAHSVRITGLTPNTLYTVKPAGTDRAGNAFVGGNFSVRTGR